MFPEKKGAVKRETDTGIPALLTCLAQSVWNFCDGFDQIPEDLPVLRIKVRTGQADRRRVKKGKKNGPVCRMTQRGVLLQDGTVVLCFPFQNVRSGQLRPADADLLVGHGAHEIIVPLVAVLPGNHSFLKINFDADTAQPVSGYFCLNTRYVVVIFHAFISTPSLFRAGSRHESLPRLPRSADFHSENRSRTASDHDHTVVNGR